jgi:hypothetical protein
MNDMLRVYGFLEVFEEDRRILRIDNMVMTTGLTIISRLLGNGAGNPQVAGVGLSDISDIAVSRMVLSSRASPPAPSADDTSAVLGTILPARPMAVFYPDAVSVQFATTIPPNDTDYAGVQIREEALLSSATYNHLFARTTFSPITKAAPALTFRHTFRFERT